MNARSLISTPLFFLALGPTLFACKGEERAQHWTATDSAGVSIVQNEPPEGWSVPQWALAERPSVLIEQDESDPRALWTHLRSVFWYEDGAVGLGVADAPFLRLFSSSGDLQMTLGEQGDGPGEHRAAVWAGAWGDSLLIRGPRGLAMYDGQGEYLSMISFPGEQSEVLAATESGLLVRVQKPYDDDHGAGPPQLTAEMSVVQAHLDGRADTLLSFEQVLTWRVQDALWGRLRHVASDGRSVYVMDSRDYEIRKYVDGRLTEIVRAPVPTLREFESRHFEALESEWGPIASRLLESDREAGRLIIPPAVAIVVDDRTGELWIRRTDDGPGAPRIWDIFESGAWTATIEVPAQFSIRAVRDRRVLGSWTDDLGVTGARVYSVVPNE